MTELVIVILVVTYTVAELRLPVANEKRVRRLIQNWAPLVWLAPEERFLPLGVTEFLDNVQSDQYYLRTKIDVGSLLKNRSSFLYGRKPAGTVPVYALVKNCVSDARMASKQIIKNKMNTDTSNDLKTQMTVRDQVQQITKSQVEKISENSYQKLHFHVTYWMFYPFSEGKTICVLDLGFFGNWPIPTIGGVCVGTLKGYGSHIGDWEHMSLYFKSKEHPLAMYVSAHDSGAFYQYNPQSGTFIYESQETRKGLFQKPTFPEKVYTAGGSHPILFSARGSHGLWTAPGKHRFVRVPRLYDESGFGTAWPTWKRLELLLEEDNESLPGWMAFRGKWGNPSSNCHPLAKLGFNICEFVDGPTGIPMKKFNFQC
ncbi:putative vacuolar protein sorting-associated protein TDA6 isoform X2 [Pseudomyrmex gracilis]|uniref:putative vacuolar protein sorting-associated protein TDA6 isoform X2 n=1 Tax=Pseudomyrmex gracilis TaxID=219809 RepID=UPI0009956E31|nr:putative vacuolar protein sorting-associated protein TDA6 isoform X2 [Pseudomyrmex gracilis]